MARKHGQKEKQKQKVAESSRTSYNSTTVNFKRQVQHTETSLEKSNKMQWTVVQ